MAVKSAEHYMIRGYHVYKNIWILELGEVLTTKGISMMQCAFGAAFIQLLWY